MNIRPCRRSDAAPLAALAIQVWLHTYAREGINGPMARFVLEQFTPDYFRRIQQADHLQLLLAHEGALLRGFITIDLEAVSEAGPGYGYEIVTLYVQEPFQGQGLGSALLERVSAEYGYPHWLRTWVHNGPAISWYQGRGFEEVGETAFILEGEAHTNLILARGAARPLKTPS